MPEARVFRPRSEAEDKLIDGVLKVHHRSGHIQKPSWTQYVSYLMNKDLAEVRAGYRKKVGR